MKLKKLMCSILSIATLLQATSIYANNYGYNGFNYEFNNSYENNQFGNSTTSNINVDYTDKQNIRSNKDTSYLPTSYGYFSGVFATDLASPYHKSVLNTKDSISVQTQLVYQEETGGTFLPPTSTKPIININKLQQ